MNIAVDLDGVLGDFVPSFLNYYNNRFNTDFKKEDIKTMDLWVALGLPSKDVFDPIQYEFYKSSYFKNIKPIEDSQEAIKRLDALGHTSLISTGRPQKVRDQTFDFIKTYFPEINRIFMTKNYYDPLDIGSDALEKYEVALFNDCKYAIEDDPIFAVPISENGTKVLLFNQPWNASFTGNGNILRVGDWPSIVDIIKNQRF